MEKKKIIKFIGIFVLLIVVFLPGYSKFQELAYRDKLLKEKIKNLETSNKGLKKEQKRLQGDPTYLEKVARDKLKVTKKGEVIYKMVDEKPEEKQR